MKPVISHRWRNLSWHDAIKIQNRLLQFVKIQPLKDFSSIKKLAACDVSYRAREKQICAAVGVFDFPSLKIIEKITLTKHTRGLFPYIPGLLSFREIPPLIEIFDKLENEPDAILMDGQGIAHPRGMGLATHIGVIFSKISVGCAKSHLWGEIPEEPGKEKGNYTFIYPVEGQNFFSKNKKIPVGKPKEPVGAVLRTREGVKPVFVSAGNRIDTEWAVKLVMSCVKNYRLPEPLRIAHQLTQTT